MIVLGADMHKSSHTIAAVTAGTGEMLGDQTVAVGARGFAAVLKWACAFEGERVWALEDCRHVSGSFERFLIARGGRMICRPSDAIARVTNPSSSYRVLTVDGAVADGFVPAGPGVPDDEVEVRRILRKEGVRIDRQGKASPAQRFHAADWSG